MKRAYLCIVCLLAAVGVNSPKADAQATLNLKCYIEGYYKGNGLMRPVLLNEMVTGATNTQTDTITVELHNSTFPYVVVESAKTILMTNGLSTPVFSNGVIGGSYYIGVKHRNILQAWSSSSVGMTAVTNYDFSKDSTYTYAQCVFKKDSIWAFSSGDLNQDDNIDLIDFPILDFGIKNGLYGYYPADLNGDGNVDLFDWFILDYHINMGTFGACHP